VGKEPWRSFCGQPPCGQLNPTNENVYLILQRLYEDFLEAFEVDTFHVGGDEVVSKCWDGIPHMKEYMHEHNLQTHLDVWGNFHNQSYERLKAANQNKPVTAIVWSSGLTGSSIGKRYLDPSHFVVQIWETGTSYQIGDLLKSNYRLIFSNVDAMYLDFGQGSWLGGDHDYKYHNWQVFYDNDLDRIISRSTNGKPQLVSQYAKLVLGGIATLWTEKVNENTMDAKLWPRGAALAERLWTNPKTRRDDVVYARLNHQTKRLQDRGVRCATLQPFSCLQMTGNCNDPQNPLR
jgi:hexosaminidase